MKSQYLSDKDYIDQLENEIRLILNVITGLQKLCTSQTTQRMGLVRENKRLRKKLEDAKSTLR